MSTEDAEKKDVFFYTAGPALMSGAAQAILFNPFDRALYVRVKFRRQHFLDRRNFEHPFQGFLNAAVYRTLVGASYMFWQDSARIFIEREMPEYMQASQSPRLNAFLIGASAGSLNGAVLNGMQVVKYRMWNLEGNPSFLAVARELYSESGTRIFFRGAGATALRDCVFGVVYESCRRTNTLKDLLDPYVLSAERRAQLFQGAAVAPSCRITRDDEASHSDGEREPIWKSTKCGTCAFISNLIAALLASIASSPFNYLRSVIYGAPSGSVPMRYASLLHSFLFQARFIYYRGESFTDGKSVGVGGGQPLPPAGKAYQQYRLSKEVERLRGKLTARAVRRSRHPMAAWRWVNSRLNIGWGSVRVGLGMAIGQSLFHMLQDILRGV